MEPNVIKKYSILVQWMARIESLPGVKVSPGRIEFSPITVAVLRIICSPDLSVSVLASVLDFNKDSKINLQY